MGRARALAAAAAALAIGGVVVATGPAPSGGTSTRTSPTTSSTTTTTVATTTPAPPSALVCATRLVDAWSDARLAREVVAVSTTAAQIGAMGPAAHEGYGALLVFGASAPTAFPTVVARLQSTTPGGLAMLVMTDEEGGGVARLTNLVAAPPWAATMGARWSAARIRAAGESVGESLLAAGVNVDLAPVLDVDGRAVYPGARDPDGLRSFSGAPATVAADGSAFAEGLAAAGVTAVVKHFPGLGGATGNTDDAPAATEPWPTLRAGALVPFETAIAAAVPGVMVANARVPGLTAQPASLSPAVYRYLRTSMGFTGLAMTDSLGAGAISAAGYSVPAASVAALEAGADLVLAGTPSSPAASLALANATAAAVVAAVRGGTLARGTLVAAAAQVVAARNRPSC